MITLKHIGTILIFVSLAIGYIGIYKNVYKQKAEMASNSVTGENHLNQNFHNPCSGGSYEGLEVEFENLIQETESTLSYLISRLSKNRVFTFDLKYKYDGDSISIAQIKELSNLCYNK